MLDGFVKKYESFGETRGSVKLSLKSREDTEAMEGLFGKSFQGHKSISVSAGALKKALAESRFSEADLNAVIRLYAGGDIEVRSLEAKREETAYCRAIIQLQDADGDEVSGRFLTELSMAASREKQNLSPHVAAIHKMLLRQYHIYWKEQEEKAVGFLNQSLMVCIAVLEKLPVRSKTYRYLAVFAADITGNPHAFDRGTALGALIGKILLWYEEQYSPRKQIFSSSGGSAGNYTDGFSSVSRGQLFLTCGILIDDVSNYATLYNVTARRENGEADAGMKGFQLERSIVQVPLSAITKWTSAEGSEGRILIVENPSLFSVLVSMHPERSYMCMNGQPRLAGLLMVQLLLHGNTAISYGGDLDPEGILIADRLWKFSGRNMTLWHMSRRDYLLHVKEAPQKDYISEHRLKMLDKIDHPVLKETALEVCLHKKPVYQENLMHEIIS